MYLQDDRRDAHSLDVTGRLYPKRAHPRSNPCLARVELGLALRARTVLLRAQAVYADRRAERVHDDFDHPQRVHARCVDVIQTLLNRREGVRGGRFAELISQSAGNFVVVGCRLGRVEFYFP